MSYGFEVTRLILSSLLMSSLMMVPLTGIVSAQAQDRTSKISATSADNKLSENALRQIQALDDEKSSRTPAQQKIDSQLLYALRMARGEEVAKGISKIEVQVATDKEGLTLVDIDALVSDETLERIIEAGGEIINSFANENAIRASVPLLALEKIAAISQIKFIRPADEAHTNRTDPRNTGGDLPPNRPATAKSQSSGKLFEPFKQPLLVNPLLDATGKPSFATRAANVRAQLTRFLEAKNRADKNGKNGETAGRIGSRTSQGDVAHRADEGRATFGVNGAGIRVGVLSDSFNSLGAAANDVASGDLPGPGNPNGFTTPVTVLQDTAGSDEGRAMLQIVHDLAPGAKLYFATAFLSVASFANNIRALRQAGCDIIIDDVFYSNESPFQDAPIARAVNDVTIGPGALAGASYFSSAGNAGNLTDNTSGVWEGDFNDSGAGGFGVTTAGTFHDFDPSATTAIQNPVFRTSGVNTAASLFWSDPLGGSTNDYDLYLIENNGTAIVSASTNLQNGTQDPYEQVTVGGSTGGAPGGRRIAIFKKTAAAARYLHMNLNRFQFAPSAAANIPAFATDGQTKGHSAAVAAFSTAATQATNADFTSANVSETFSSDGLRRVFYNADGTPVTPGCFLVSCGGGTVRQKPDVTAADGVDTTLPTNSGLNPFFGTSAAAPHAGAIAALLKSANLNLTAAQIRTALTSTAIDIETVGIDRTTGVGIVTAFDALQSINATPQASVNVISSVATPGGDGDAFIERGESATIATQIKNTGAANATNVTATLTTSTPGVTITQGTATYSDLMPSAAAAASAPFAFTLGSNTRPGLKINFTLSVAFTGGVASPETANFTVQTGEPGTVAAPSRFTAAIAINDLQIRTVTFPVSGYDGNISDLNFSFDGTSCSNTVPSTTVGVEHSNVSHLVFELQSPAGTVATLASRTGGAGVNFCQTIFDDSAATSIQSATAAQAPFTGSFRPATPLAPFIGEDPNGNWILRISDFVAGNTGNLRAFSLVVTPFVNALAPTAAAVTVSGRVTNNTGRGLTNAVVTVTALNGEVRTARTNSFGHYQFTNVAAGETYIFSAAGKGYRFSPRVLNIMEEASDVNFSALP